MCTLKMTLDKKSRSAEKKLFDIKWKDRIMDEQEKDERRKITMEGKE